MHMHMPCRCFVGAAAQASKDGTRRHLMQSRWPGAPIEAWWSEPKASEKVYHSKCATLMVGHHADVPCYHLFVHAQPTPLAWLYTASEDFCCRSDPPPSLLRSTIILE